MLFLWVKHYKVFKATFKWMNEGILGLLRLDFTSHCINWYVTVLIEWLTALLDYLYLNLQIDDFNWMSEYILLEKSQKPLRLPIA